MGLLAGATPPAPTVFGTAAAVRAWLEAHHATATALWVGVLGKRQEHGA